jgi:hypothetical protein
MLQVKTAGLQRPAPAGRRTHDTKTVSCLPAQPPGFSLVVQFEFHRASGGHLVPVIASVVYRAEPRLNTELVAQSFGL